MKKEIVITLDEDIYSFLTKSDFLFLAKLIATRYTCDTAIVKLIASVRKGIVLPEDHGNLVDINELPIILEARKENNDNDFI